MTNTHTPAQCTLTLNPKAVKAVLHAVGTESASQHLHYVYIYRVENKVRYAATNGHLAIYYDEPYGGCYIQDHEQFALHSKDAKAFAKNKMQQKCDAQAFDKYVHLGAHELDRVYPDFSQATTPDTKIGLNFGYMETIAKAAKCVCKSRSRAMTIYPRGNIQSIGFKAEYGDGLFAAVLMPLRVW